MRKEKYLDRKKSDKDSERENGKKLEREERIMRETYLNKNKE